MSEKIRVRTRYVRWWIGRNNKELGWLARKIRVSQQYLSMILGHKRNPKAPLREKMQKVMGARWDDLFYTRAEGKRK